MNQEEVRSYLAGPGSNELDLVVLPRRYLELMMRKDIGLSAESILRKLAGVDIGGTRAPLDESDMRRCLWLVSDFPELRERLSLMSEVSPEWAIIVSHWSNLEEAWRGRHLVVGGPSDLGSLFKEVRNEIVNLASI